MADLTDYEWQLAQRYRDDLFDQDLGSDLSLIDPEHPLTGGITAMLGPIASRRSKAPRKQRSKPTVIQERLDL